jgi:hypothetical protein
MSDVSGQTASTIEDVGQPWHRLVTPSQWRVWFASMLGWLFDGYEGYALVLVLIPALSTLVAEGALGLSENRRRTARSISERSTE